MEEPYVFIDIPAVRSAKGTHAPNLAELIKIWLNKYMHQGNQMHVYANIKVTDFQSHKYQCYTQTECSTTSSFSTF
jgi:hypothetical protein